MLWNLVFSLFEIAWVMSTPVREILLGWYGCFVRKNERKFERLSHHARFSFYGRKGTEEHLNIQKQSDV